MFKNLFAKKPSNERTAKALAHEETLRTQAQAKARAQVVLKRLQARKAQNYSKIKLENSI